MVNQHTQTETLVSLRVLTGIFRNTEAGIASSYFSASLTIK